MKALTSLAALVAATLSLVPATAQGAPPAGSSQIVHYGDLDLSRAADVRKLDHRLRAAIDRACGPTSAADPAGARWVRQCRTALRAEVGERRAEVLAGNAGTEPIVVALAQ
jgi:UrcA family protein